MQKRKHLIFFSNFRRPKGERNFG
uniref:Uncharacterized protein n=1 Tax=Anguilla anguilla TaxID=7936 RepID=A0A0E9VZF4_ANGAN